jgi:hypothetical protein
MLVTAPSSTARTARVALTLLALSGAFVASPAVAADPTKAQCIAANENAQDLRTAGKLIEARTQLAVCVAESCPGAVRQDCAQRLADLDKALPTLVVVARDAQGNDLGGVRATIDGKALPDALNGTAIPLDPGEHHLVLDAPGVPQAEKTVVIHEGEKARREVVVFGAGAASTATPEEGTVMSSTSSVPPPGETPSAASGPGPGDTQRKVGLALGGVGAVGIVVGSIFGLVAKSSFDHGFKDECNGKTSCTSSQGVSDVQGAYDQATVSDVAFVAGAVLLGAGAAVYLMAPRGGVSVSPAVGTRGGGLTVRGTW